MRQAHARRAELAVDRAAERVHRAPLRLGVRARHARVFVNPRHRHLELERRLAGPGEAGDRGGARRERGRRERDMALAGQHSRSRVEPDPARPGHVRLGPRVQIGEVRRRSRGPFERTHIGDELNEIAGHEARGEPQMPQDLDEQPARVAARSRGEAQRVVGGLDSRLHAHEVLHFALQALVQRDEEVDRVDSGLEAAAPEVVEPLREQRAGGLLLAIRRELGGELGGVVEREVLGPVLDEEVERVDDGHVGNQIDRHRQRLRLLGKDQPRDVVPVGVLLPVDEVRLGLDAQGVAVDRRAAMRRRAQPHLVRREAHRPVEGVPGPVVEGDADGHAGFSSSQYGSGSCANTRRRPSPHW